MAPPKADPGTSGARPRAGKVGFWSRVTEGARLTDLWRQFAAEARAGYDLYSREVDWESLRAARGARRWFRIAGAFFWAMFLKLSPARRVVLLFSVLLSTLMRVEFRSGNSTFAIDFRLVSLAGVLAVLALELADRVTMKRDLEIARDIQRWLVPERPPEVPGLDIAFATRPANTVAGDYYDAFLRDGRGGKLLVVVADVAGKSVPAALLMATFQAALHSCAADPDPPEGLAGRLNRFVCTRSLDGRRFTTAFIGELDLATRTLEYVNAGHNAPALRRASGAMERLERGGIPLGVDPDATYERGSSRLGPGDVLLAFTDGLTEALNAAGEEYGEARALGVIEAATGARAEDVVRRQLEDVERHAAGARQHDDITLLVLRAVA